MYGFVKAVLAFILFTMLCIFCVSASEHQPFTCDFTEYHDGVVVKNDSALVENTELDGRKAVRIVPNPDCTQTSVLKIDAFHFEGLGIDIGEYRWLVVEYKYVSDSPGSYDMIAHIKTNGGLLKQEYTQKALTAATEKLRANEWAYAVFDFRFIDEMLVEELDKHILKQMHFLPFGNAELGSLSADDTIYIGHLTFLTEEPDIKVRSPYIEGYDDGTFKPGKLLTRAESCAMIARSIDDNISGEHPFTDIAQDAWYSCHVGYCYENGIINGSGEFMPEEYITGAEFAKMVYLASLDRAERSNDQAALELSDSPNISREDAVMMINRSRDIGHDSLNITDGCVAAFLDVTRLNVSFTDIVFACSEIVYDGDVPLYIIKDISGGLTDKIGETMGWFDTEKGEAYILELDELEKQRIDEIRGSTSVIPDSYGKKWYVSSNGNDSNDGLSEYSPFGTIGKALECASDKDVILLERGSLFRGNFVIKKSITLSAYGTGDKPKIYGSPLDGADASMWELCYENAEGGAKIWRFFREDMTDVGNIVFDGGRMYAYKEIPSCTADGGYLVRNKEAEGKVFDYTAELDADLEFFHSANSALSTSAGTINISKATGPLYLRCDAGNPGEIFESIEFSPRGNTISVNSDSVTIDNICVMYAGSHGVGAGTRNDLTVTNCEFGWIGGSVQHYQNTYNRVTRFGNGVEIYGGCDGYLVRDCYIYQCYDAGVTHQFNSGGGDGDYVMYNVTYKDNLITDCVYSIEYFFNELNGYIRDGNNILFEGNIMRRCGFGFGSTRPNGYAQRHIRSNPYGNPFRNFVIRDNILDRSVTDLVRIQFSDTKYSPKMYGNTYIVGVGNGLFTYGIGAGTEYTADSTTVTAIKTVLGDRTGKVYFCDHVPYYEYVYRSDY